MTHQTTMYEQVIFGHPKAISWKNAIQQDSITIIITLDK